MKPDYELKSKVLKTNYCQLVKEHKKIKWLLSQNEFENLKLIYQLEEQQQVLRNLEYYREAEKICKATHNRNTRLRARVESLISKTAVFVTLTFTDKVLETTSAETRRRYVHYFLKSTGGRYVANLDFGSQNGREHYHGIIQIDQINPTEWKYGALNVKKIRPTSEPLQLAKYISKLTNHAIKETTKRSAIIYSRD